MDYSKSRTKMKRQSRRKTNPVLHDTIREGLKHPAWRSVVASLTGSTKYFRSMNLSEIDSETQAGDSVVLVGKVLGVGELTKKVRICALGFSEKAGERIRKSKSEVVSLLEEMKNNPKAEGIRVL